MAERKRIGVPISGLDISTPYHSVTDGKCETLHNLRYTNDAWRDMKPFNGKESRALQLVYKHPASPSNHYLIIEEGVNKAVEYYALTANDTTYYTSKPLADLAQGDILYTMLLNRVLKMGIILSIKQGVINYEPISQYGGVHIFSYNARLISSDSKQTRKTLFFLNANPVVGDAVYEKEDDTYRLYGYISGIENEMYLIQVGNDTVSTLIQTAKLLERSLLLPLKYTIEHTGINTTKTTIYLSSQIPEVGSLIRVDKVDSGSILHSDSKAVRVVSVSTEQTVVSDGEILDKPAWTPREYMLITITAIDSTGTESTYILDSRNFTTNSTFAELTNVSEDANNNIVDENTTISTYTLNEVDASTGDVVQDIDTFSNISSIDHFGNMLIVKDDINLHTYFYLYSNGIYSQYMQGGNCKCSIEIIDSIHSPNIQAVPIPFAAKDSDDDGYVRKYNAHIAMAEKIATKSDQNTSILINSTQEGYFRGEFAYFVVVKNTEGVEIMRSLPQVVRTETLPINARSAFLYKPDLGSDNFENHYIVYGYATPSEEWNRSNISTQDKFSYGDLWNGVLNDVEVGNFYNTIINSSLDISKSNTDTDKLYKLQLNIELLSLNEINNIDSIEVYATRLYPLFEIKDSNLAVNSVKIFEELFYRMAKLEKNERVYEITASSFANIEQGIQYEPTQAADAIYAKKGFEYNNIYHSYDIDGLAPKIPAETFKVEEGGVASDSMVETVVGVSKTYASLISPEQPFAEEQGYSIVLPNKSSRVIFGNKVGTTILANTILYPKYVEGMDISYIVNMQLPILGTIVGSDAFYKKSHNGTELQNANESTRKYNKVELLNLATSQTINIGETYPIKQSNRIQASENNNPLILPYDRSYRIGSDTNEILAINSGAIEMSDAKFGEFPLYVFTKEGIFAMQSGKDTLYSAIVPINYDVIINPNTLAVNGAVLYFTDKGLHALTNQGAKLLSQPIHTEENRIPDWMYTCQMVYMPEWNEVLCADLPSKKAYVFSLDNNVWSTRDIPEGYILNNDELVARDSIIYDLRNEEESLSSDMPFTLTTRPIKLGSMELKRAETIIVRFECPTNQTLNVKVEGSIDTQNWGELRKIEGVQTNTDILIRRTTCSVKYLRFTIEGNVTDDIRILAFEVEYYERMRHRMR